MTIARLLRSTGMRRILNLSGFWFLALAGTAGASCVPSTAAERLARADAVFVGRVVSVNTEAGTARFYVLRVRKGRLRRGDRPRVHATPFRSSVTIGWTPRRGERWRIYARRDAGRWTTNDCLGSRRVR